MYIYIYIYILYTIYYVHTSGISCAKCSNTPKPKCAPEGDKMC